MQSDKRWINAINEAEQHQYLGSNLTFLIDFAKDDVKEFERYYKKFNKIFKEDKENFLFQRALLTKSDYLPGRGNSSYFTFCKFKDGDKSSGNRNKDDNWRSVFFDKKKSQIVKELLEDERNLEKIIDDFNRIDWRYYFIKYPEILKECSNFWIFWILVDYYTIRVLTGAFTNSYHVEYYTFALFITLQRRFPNLPDEKLGYEWAKSYGENPHISIGGTNISFIKNNDGKYFWMIDEERIGETFDPNLPEQDPLQSIIDKAYKMAQKL